MMKLRVIRVYHVAAHSRGPESLDVVFHDSETKFLVYSKKFYGDIEFYEGVCAVEDSVDEIIKKLQAFRQIEGQPKYDSDVNAFAVEAFCSIQDLVRGLPIMPSLIPIELYLFNTTMMRSIRKLIGTPLDSAPTVPVQNTTLQDQECEKEIFIDPVGVPDDDHMIDLIDVVPVAVVDVVIDVSGDDQRDHTIQAKYSSDGIVFYVCTETFGMSESDVVVLYDSRDVTRAGRIFFSLVLWSCLLGVVNALSLAESFDAPFIKDKDWIRAHRLGQSRTNLFLFLANLLLRAKF
ncbi:unnamed protein product [Cuscuta campestris]|uniref:Uncharacterized protein n=1 Tax=Cuscuta campestris TaxID=132261 RepID=A0A484KQK1_9ASTE|nr:unnamed protein product [Cuscuta campestris]